MLTIRHVHESGVERVERDRLGEVLAATDDGYVWVDLSEPTTDEQSVLDAPALDLDPLAIEDIREDIHLPKLDVFTDRLLLTVHAVQIDASAVELSTTELDVVIGPNLLVTFRRRGIAAVSTVADQVDRAGSGSTRGPGHDAPHSPPRATDSRGARLDRPVLVVHRILDVMEDVFVPFLDLLGQRLELVEEDVVRQPTPTTRAEIFALRRDLITLRRILVPQAEVLRRLSREPMAMFEPGDRAYFDDIYDHLHRMAEVSEVYRQLVESAYDMYRSVREDETNRRVTVLTMVSALLLPIGVIAGVYGMNFTNMPELDARWAYPAVLATFVAIIVVGLAIFRSWGWIGGGDTETEDDHRRRLVERLELPRVGRVLQIPAYGARFSARSSRKVASVGQRLAGRGRRVIPGQRHPARERDEPA